MKTAMNLVQLHTFLRVVLFVCLFCLISTVTAQDAASGDQIDAYLRQLPSDYFSGSVLVAQNGDIVLHEGYGLANDDEGTPVTVDTIFDIGSLSKQFTAAAVLHLQAAGLLSVEDTLETFFNDVPADKAGITLHQLLTHTSGLEENHVESDLEAIERDQALERIFAQDLLFDPGAGYAYSNSGYSVLAAVIESVSGQSYQSYLQQNLFAPVGMQHTGFHDDPATWDGDVLATGYMNGEGMGTPLEREGFYWGVVGNGAILSTTGDLYLWWQAIYEGDLLPADIRSLLFTPHADEGDGSFYGYGWAIADTDYGQRIEHNGGGIGGNSIFTAYTEQNLVIIILSNRIVLRETFGIPCRVELPADEIGQQLALNIFSDDFSLLPEKTLTVCE
jgi:CubicO group peptidase (beta-lactamase class C family)